MQNSKYLLTSLIFICTASPVLAENNQSRMLLSQTPTHNTELPTPRSLTINSSKPNIALNTGIYEAFDGDETIGHLTAAVEYSWSGNLAFVFEFVGYFVDQRANDAWGGGFNILTRWKFYNHQNTSLFFDGGAGIAEFSKRVPAPDGTHFNFTLHAGIGLKHQINDDLIIHAGLRYIHISNAGLKGSGNRNPGIDGLGAYIGLTLNY